MKLFRLKLLALLIVTCCGMYCQGQSGGSSSAPNQCPQRTTVTINASGTSQSMPNDCGVVSASFEELITGSPATMSVVIAGCMRGNGTLTTSCTTLDTSSSTSSTHRKPAIDTVYDFFKVTATWTGGTSPTVTINSTMTTAVNGNNGIPSTVTPNLCFLSVGVGNQGQWLACSGTASTNFASLTPGTMPAGNFNVGTGATIAPTGSGIVNANQVHGVDLATLATCIMRNTTATGVLVCAVAGDFPTLNQPTTGNAATASNLTGSPLLPSGVTVATKTAGDVTAAPASDLFVSQNYVPLARTINAKALSANVTLAFTDFAGAISHAQLPTLLTGDIPNNAANTSGTAHSLDQVLPHALLPTLLSADIPNNTANSTGSAHSLDATATIPGTVLGVTQTPLNNSTRLATTQYVDAAIIANPNGVATINGNAPVSGNYVLVSGDIPNNAANTSGTAANVPAGTTFPSVNVPTVASGTTWGSGVGGTLSGLAFFKESGQSLASAGTCNSAAKFTEANITDSTQTAVGATITGGGTHAVKAVCSGTNWIISALVN